MGATLVTSLEAFSEERKLTNVIADGQDEAYISHCHIYSLFHDQGVRQAIEKPNLASCFFS